MILNRVNEENGEEDINEDEEANNQPEENEEQKERNTKKEKNETENEEEEDWEENEEEEDDEEENEEKDEKEKDEDVDYEDNHKKKMISKDSEEENINTLKNKIFYYKIFTITLIIIVILIVLIIILSIRKGKNKISLLGRTTTNQNNETVEVNLNQDKLNTVKSELNNIYSNEGEVNIIKFYEEKINQKVYNSPDNTRFKSVHIAIGFNEADIDTVIKHLASAIFHSSPTSFLHIHMMDADTFSYESLIKLNQ